VIFRCVSAEKASRVTGVRVSLVIEPLYTVDRSL